MAKTVYYATPSYLKPTDKQKDLRNVMLGNKSYGNTAEDKRLEQKKIDDANYVKPKVFQDMSQSYKDDYVKMKDFRVAELAKKKPTYLEPTINKGVRAATKNDKVVHQGKVVTKPISRPDNPFAPAVVNFANTVSLGLLERNSKTIDQLKAKAPISSAIGSLAGYILLASAGTKLLKPLTSKIAKPLAKRVVESGLVGGGISAAEGFVKDRGLKQTAKDVAINTALGGVLDVGLYGAGKLVSKGVQKFAKKATESVIPITNAITPKNSLTQPNGFKATIKRPTIETKIETPSYLKPQETPQVQSLKVNNANGKLKPSIVQMKNDTLPLKDRDIFNVSNKKVNAYQYDNPTVKPYMAEEARIMKGEIERGSSPITAKTNNVKIPGGSNDAVETLGYGNIPSVRSETTKELNKLGTYKQIDKALDDIIHDKGKENYALAKKVELTLDERMTKGYREDVLGQEIPPNSEYLQEKAFIDGIPQQMNTSTINKAQLQSKLKTQATIKPPSANTPMNTKLPTTEQLQPNNIIPMNGKSRFANVTVENSANTTEQLAKDLKELNLGYDKVTNEQSLIQANNRISADLEKSVKYVMDTKEGSAEHTTTAIQLINKFQKEGNYERAIDIASDISSKLTKNGQAIQAASIYDRLSPEGILLYAQKQVNKLNDERWFKGLTKEQKINPDLAKQLQELSANMKNLTGDAKTEASQELQQVLQALGKSSPLRKIESAQTIGQLLNPKTLIRNAIGNEIFYRVERINKYIATPIDIARSVITKGERTVTFKTGKQGGYWDGFFKGTKAGWKGVNPGGLQTQFDLTAPAFSGKWNPMTYLEKTLGATLKGFDYAAYTRAVNQTVGEMGTLNAINKGLKGQAKQIAIKEFVGSANKNILDIADQYGKYVTFQDDNVLSKGLSAIKKGMNLGKEFGAGSLVIKYPKTPGALVMRGLDYSPAGFLKSAYTVAKPFLKGGKVDTRQATMELSKAITGTLGFTGLGYFLADNDVITGRFDKDKDVRDLENQTGTGSYKVNLTALERWAKSGFDSKTLKLQDGDTMFSYDWMQPVAMALSFGANINSNLKENEGALNSTSSVIASSLEGAIGTITEQPVLQGLARQFQGYDLGQNATNTLKGIPSSFTPTVLNQVRQLQDNTGRSTYDPSPVKEALNKSQVKIPGLSQKLPKAYDTEGKEKENFQNGSNNLFNVMLNPGFVSKSQSTPMQKEILRIYNDSGLKTQFPTVAPKTIPKSSTNPLINLTAAQMSEYQQLMGRYTLQTYTNAMATDKYKNYSSDEDKAKVLSNAMSDARENAKIEMLKKLNKYWGLK